MPRSHGLIEPPVELLSGVFAVVQDAPEEMSGKVLLPGESRVERKVGTVVGVGEGVDVEIGSRVLWTTSWQSSFEWGDVLYLLMTKDDLAGVLKEPKRKVERCETSVS